MHGFVARHRRKISTALLAGLVLFVGSFPVHAQTVQTNQAQLARETQPSFTPTPAPGSAQAEQAVASPNDTDLGEQQILKRTPEYQAFTISFTTPVFYTSNVALTPTHELSDVVIAPTAAVYYQPRITKTLYANLNAPEQIFYYGNNPSFDFGSLDVEAGLNYFLPQLHSLVLRGEYDFNRLTSGDRLGDEFFSNHELVFNAELPFQLNRAQQISVGANTNISVGADHQSPRRNDYEGYISYSVNLTRAFSINAVGRGVVRDYHQNGRTDVGAIISLTGTCRLTNWCSLSAISSFAHSDSNQDMFDYDVANAGGVLALSMKF